MEKIEVTIMSKEEIKELKKNGVKFTKNLASHLNRNDRIAKALTAEITAYKDYAKKTLGIVDNAVVTIENRPSADFSKDEFIAVYGEEEYKRFCIVKDKLYVTFHG